MNSVREDQHFNSDRWGCFNSIADCVASQCIYLSVSARRYLSLVPHPSLCLFLSSTYIVGTPRSKGLHIHRFVLERPRAALTRLDSGICQKRVSSVRIPSILEYGSTPKHHEPHQTHCTYTVRSVHTTHTYSTNHPHIHTVGCLLSSHLCRCQGSSQGRRCDQRNSLNRAAMP